MCLRPVCDLDHGGGRLVRAAPSSRWPVVSAVVWWGGAAQGPVLLGKAPRQEDYIIPASLVDQMFDPSLRVNRLQFFHACIQELGNLQQIWLPREVLHHLTCLEKHLVNGHADLRKAARQRPAA